MILRFYAIKDEVAGHFNNPFCAQNDLVARNNYASALLHQDVNEYDITGKFIYFLFEYDNDKGMVIQKNKPTEVANCMDIFRDVEKLKKKESK